MQKYLAEKLCKISHRTSDMAVVVAQPISDDTASRLLAIDYSSVL